MTTYQQLTGLDYNAERARFLANENALIRGHYEQMLSESSKLIRDGMKLIHSIELDRDKWKARAEKAEALLIERHSIMTKLSTGDDSTIGNYRKLSAALFGEDSPATKFLDERIANEGAGAEVTQSESQMVMLLLLAQLDMSAAQQEDKTK